MLFIKDVARSIPFDNATNGFTAEEVQSAIEEASSGAISKVRDNIILGLDHSRNRTTPYARVEFNNKWVSCDSEIAFLKKVEQVYRQNNRITTETEDYMYDLIVDRIKQLEGKRWNYTRVTVFQKRWWQWRQHYAMHAGKEQWVRI